MSGTYDIIGSDNGLAPGRRQAIIWTNAVILLIQTLGTNSNKISIETLTFWFKKKNLKVLSEKWRPFCLGPNVLYKVFIIRFWFFPSVSQHESISVTNPGVMFELLHAVFY